MLKEIKEAIKQNTEIKKALQGCSDDFILEHASLIYKALADEEVFDGYKIKIWVEDNQLLWEYAPVSEKTIKETKIKRIASKYTFKLSIDQEKLYLTDLNDIKWTKDKAAVANKIKRMFKELEEKKEVKGFWLFGPHNSGKSFMMLPMLNMIADMGIKVAYVPVNELIVKTQGTFQNGSESQYDVLNSINDAKVLVIDDLGVERSTPWFKENILLPILDHRAMAGKVTIFASNVSIDAYGARLKHRSQSPETEEVTNDKIIARIRHLVDEEIEIG